ncbi:MAG: hypothetical protein IJI65_01020 [Lachnospiraceae bacterium]|nr:hypothetical protein [Lachnospiraceae bacterium]
MKIKKGVKKFTAMILTLALVLVGAGTATGFSGIFEIKAKAEGVLNHSVTAGTVYKIGDHNYVAATTTSGEALFIAQEPSTYTYVYGGFNAISGEEITSPISTNFDLGILTDDLHEAGLTPELTMWDYYEQEQGGRTSRQGFYGVPSQTQVEAAISGLSSVTGWTSTNVDDDNAYYLNSGVITSGDKDTSRKALLAFYLDLSEEVHIYTSGSNTVIEFAVPIDEEHFPDENFRDYLSSQTYGSDGIITKSEIAEITDISCGNKSISNLTGIEHFTALTSLNCQYNQLTSLDVTHNPALQSLHCDGNNINSLDVTQNSALTDLDCGGNNLTSLDVTHNPALSSLQCYHNNLTTLDVSNNPDLTQLWCSNSGLTTLDVSHNLALTTLDCGNNQFTLLKVKYGSSGSLATITNGGHGSFGVTYISYYDNDYAITLSATPTAGFIFDSWETTGDVTQSDNTFYFSTGDATITATWEEEQYVPIDEKHFPDENFRNFLLLQTYGADGILTQTEIASITSMNCAGRNIADLTGIEHFTALTELGCYGNNLTTLDVSGCEALCRLDCSNNHLTALDVSHNTALTSLWCDYNPLTDLKYSLAASNGGAVEITNGGHGTFMPFWESYDTISKKLTLTIDDYGVTNTHVFANWAAEGTGVNLSMENNGQTATVTFSNTEDWTDKSVKIFGLWGERIYVLTVKEVYQDENGEAERTETATENHSYNDSVTKTTTVPEGYSIVGESSQTVTMDDNKEITFTYRKNDPAADPNNIVINAAHFPDENFRNFLLSQTYGADGILTPEEIASITSMNCSSQNIADLTGIEHFTALTSLIYSLNPLSTCDLSSLTALEELVCTGVQYTSLKMPFNSGSITATVTGGGHGKFTMGSYDANEKSFMLSSPDADDTGYIFKGWSATGATKAFSYSNTKFIVGDDHATITATWEAVPDTYTLTVNEIYLYADGTTEKTEVSTSTHEDGEEVTVTKTAPAGYTLYGEASQTFTMDEDKTAVFTYVKNASDPDPDPADPIVSDHVFTSSSLLMRWQGLSGERVVKRVGNVTITGSKQYGRLYGAALIVIDPTSLPDGKSVSVSIPQKHINLTVGGVTLTATIEFEDVTLVNTDGSRQYVVTVITDRSDLPYEDFFGKTIIGDIRYSVEFS